MQWIKRSKGKHDHEQKNAVNDRAPQDQSELRIKFDKLQKEYDGLKELVALRLQEDELRDEKHKELIMKCCAEAYEKGREVGGNKTLLARIENLQEDEANLRISIELCQTKFMSTKCHATASLLKNMSNETGARAAIVLKRLTFMLNVMFKMGAVVKTSFDNKALSHIRLLKDMKGMVRRVPEQKNRESGANKHCSKCGDSSCVAG